MVTIPWYDPDSATPVAVPTTAAPAAAPAQDLPPPMEDMEEGDAADILAGLSCMPEYIKVSEERSA